MKLVKGLTMDSYIEITVLPDLEADANFLMNNLCSKLHAVLGQVTMGKVGVSFPGYALAGKNLGTKLRIHGTAFMLEKLMAENWIKGLRDYCQCSYRRPMLIIANINGHTRWQIDPQWQIKLQYRIAAITNIRNLAGVNNVRLFWVLQALGNYAPGIAYRSPVTKYCDVVFSVVGRNQSCQQHGCYGEKWGD